MNSQSGSDRQAMIKDVGLRARQILAADLLIAGLAKLPGRPMMVGAFDKVGSGHWIRKLTGWIGVGAAFTTGFPGVVRVPQACVLGVTNGSRTRGASLDTSGEGPGQEGDQLFATGIRERLGAEHVIHDREPRELCHDHDGPDRGVVAADLLGEERELGAVEVPPEQLDGAGHRGGMQQEQERRRTPIPRVLPPVHHDPGEVVGQVPPLALEQVPHVEGAPDHLGEEPLLGAEVAVDQRGGHAGVRGDLADPGAS